MQALEPILDRIYQKKSDIVFRQIADQALLVPIKGKVADMQRIFMLNGVADFVWQQLSGENPVTSICRRVEENFDVTAPQARQDVCEFIGQLLDLDLISEVS